MLTRADIPICRRQNVDTRIRYLRATEVGRGPTSSKYELHVKFKTPKNGAVVRNRMRLPHPVLSLIHI